MGRIAVLLAVLACLVLPVAAVATWVQLQVVDTSAYVGAVGPLGQEPAVRAAAATAIERTTLDAVNLAGSDTAAGIVDPAVQKIVSGDAFASAWTAGNRTAHRQLIAVLADDQGVVDDDGAISVDLSELAQPLADEVGAGGLVPTDALSRVGLSVDLVDARDLAHARRAYAAVDAVGLWPLAVWGALVALSLLLPGARRRVLVVLGAGSLLAAALVAGLLLVGRALLVDHVQAADADLVGAVWDALVHSLWVGLAVGSVVAVVALVVAAAAGLRRPRSA